MNRNELLRRLAVASQSGSLQEQRDLVQALAQMDKQAARDAEEERSLDWADTAIRSRMAPRIAHTMHSEQTDWMNELSTTASSDDYHNRIHAEASMWFNRVDNDVKSDPEEFREQARGIARRVTGSLGDKAEAAAQEFLSYVSFLYKNAASGLPQVQQEFDSHDQYAPTPVPPDVFPTFEGPVHPINEWVENGTETSSERPNRAQDVGGVESHSLPDEGESEDVEGYPGASDSGTGENSSHDTGDAEDRSPNENWPETEESGDAAEGSRPSEHSEEDEHTSKESVLTSLSLWDSIDDDIEKESFLGDAINTALDKVKPGGGGGMNSNAPVSSPVVDAELADAERKNNHNMDSSAPAPIQGEMRNMRQQNAGNPNVHPSHDKIGMNAPPGNFNPGQAPANAGMRGFYTNDAGQDLNLGDLSDVGDRREKALELKGDRANLVEKNREKGVSTPAPSKAASWVEARLRQKLSLHPMDSNTGGGSPHPATGTPSEESSSSETQTGVSGPGLGQDPETGEMPAPTDKPEHETLMQRRKDIAGVDSFPAPTNPTNNSNTL